MILWTSCQQTGMDMNNPPPRIILQIRCRDSFSLFLCQNFRTFSGDILSQTFLKSSNVFSRQSGKARLCLALSNVEQVCLCQAEWTAQSLWNDQL